MRREAGRRWMVVAAVKVDVDARTTSNQQSVFLGEM
jgi:hypothetical protein